ncbi:MAG: hypothetical protein AAF420_07415, partial [Pseudomonadota bacterium]
MLRSSIHLLIQVSQRWLLGGLLLSMVACGGGSGGGGEGKRPTITATLCVASITMLWTSRTGP